MLAPPAPRWAALFCCLIMKIRPIDTFCGKKGEFFLLTRIEKCRYFALFFRMEGLALVGACAEPMAERSKAKRFSRFKGWGKS